MYGMNSRSRRRRTHLGVEFLETKQLMSLGPITQIGSGIVVPLPTSETQPYVPPKPATPATTPTATTGPVLVVIPIINDPTAVLPPNTPAVTITGNFTPAEVQQMESQGDAVVNSAVQAKLAQGYVAVSSSDGNQWSFVPKNPTPGSFTWVQIGGTNVQVSSVQDLNNHGFTLVSFRDGNQWYAPPTSVEPLSGQAAGTVFVPGVVLEAELQAMTTWALVHGSLPQSGGPLFTLQLEEIAAGTSAQKTPYAADITEHLFTLGQQAYEAAHGTPHNQAQGQAECAYIQQYQNSNYFHTVATWTDPYGVLLVPTVFTDGFAQIVVSNDDGPSQTTQNQNAAHEGFGMFNVLLSGDNSGNNMKKYLSDHTWARVLVDFIALAPTVALGGWEAAVPLTVQALSGMGVDVSEAAISIAAQASYDEDLWAAAVYNA